MQLELAVAAACEPTSCRVRLLDGQTVVEARYAKPVQDRVKVRPGDMVAIDQGAEPPEVVWRWWYGVVERVEGERAVLARNVTQRKPGDARRGSETAAVPPGLLGEVNVGDTVFFFGHDEPLIVDVARSGLPAQPDRIRAGGFRGISAAYERMRGA